MLAERSFDEEFNMEIASLNDAQRLAVEHGIGDATPPPLLIIAGAGSGKTNTLAHRVARLIETGADPQRILLLTFSRRAAQEMERRVQRIVARVSTRGSVAALDWTGTFHSIGARLLRQYASRVGLDESFSIADRGDSEDLLALIRHEAGLSATKRRFPLASTCLAIYSRVINSGASLADVLEHAFPSSAMWEGELKQIFNRYVEAKSAQNVLDYDDLLLYWSYTVQEPVLARDIGGRFDHVLVDEYQDTNALQASTLLAMKPNGAGVTVVGDDAQSIYSFRAATVRNILDFPAQFTPPARVIALERNYRSTQRILDASNGVIGLARERHTKRLWTERPSVVKPSLVTVRDESMQAQYVADHVLAEREKGVALKAQAVLFRSSSHSAQLEVELARRGIRFVKYGGLKFLESAHIKDVIAVLKWIDNPRNRMAGFRALRLVPGIGPATASRLLDDIEGTTEAASRELQILRDIARALRNDGATWPADVETVIRWYEPQLERIYDDASVRQRDLVQLQNIASTYASRERFLTEMTLDPPDATSDDAGIPGRDDDFLVLSTIHSAKGQEWKVVHVLNVVDGCIPSDMATGTSDEIEEERRLLYVAMTRAKDALHIIVPQRFFVRQQSAYGDRHVYASRSRFIPQSLLSLFDVCAWPVASHVAAETLADRRPSIDIASRARAMWRDDERAGEAKPS